VQTELISKDYPTITFCGRKTSRPN